MESTHAFLNKNVSVKALANLTGLQNFCIPDPDHPFLSRNPGYLDMIIDAQVPQLKKSIFPGSIKFDMLTKLSPEIIFAELVNIGIQRGKHYDDISAVWGFDVKDLPDTAYLFRAVFYWDPKSPLIACLPQSLDSQRESEALRTFRHEKMVLLTEEMKVSNHVNKVKESDIFGAIPQHLNALKEVLGGYKSVRFEIARLTNNIQRSLAVCKDNPVVKSMLSQAKIPELMNNPGWKLLEGESGEGLKLVERVPTAMVEENPLPVGLNNLTHRPRVNRQ